MTPSLRSVFSNKSMGRNYVQTDVLVLRQVLDLICFFFQITLVCVCQNKVQRQYPDGGLVEQTVTANLAVSGILFPNCCIETVGKQVVHFPRTPVGTVFSRVFFLECLCN